MTTLPAPGSFAPEAGDNASRGQLFENWLAWCKEAPGGGPQQSLTISGGVITPNVSTVIVDTEAGAASDDLDRIDFTHRPDGSLLYVRCASTQQRRIRVRHLQGGQGEIFLSREIELFLDDVTIILKLQREGSTWFQRDIFWGRGTGQARSYLSLGNAATYNVASDAEAVLGTSTTRLLTPPNLHAVLGNYQALIGNRTTVPTVELNAELLLGAGAGGGDVVGKVTVENLLAGGFKEHFYSGELACTAGTAGDAPHGFSARPSLVQATLLCKTANLGYQPGDEINVDTVYASNETRGLLVGFTAVNIFWRVRATFNIAMLNTSNGYAVINPANWRMIVRAWR